MSISCLQGEAAEFADVVITGDFNSVPGDAPYLFLKRGRLDRGATEAYLPQVGGSAAG